MPNDTPTLASVFTDIADAIREKTGSEEQMTPTDMAQEIANIPTGGNLPEDDGVYQFDNGEFSDALSYGVYQIHDSDAYQLSDGYYEISEGSVTGISAPPEPSNSGYFYYDFSSSIWYVNNSITEEGLYYAYLNGGDVLPEHVDLSSVTQVGDSTTFTIDNGGATITYRLTLESID